MTQDLDRFKKLYSKLLEQGKDLYLLGGSCHYTFAVGLPKRERENKGANYFKLTLEDVKDYRKMFPKSTITDEEIFNDLWVQPHKRIWMNPLLAMTSDRLEKILDRKVIKEFG